MIANDSQLQKGGKMFYLANEDKIGSVTKCVHGVVHIHCKGISLHLTEEAFLKFASLIKKAESVLMDEGLSDLMQRQN